VYSGVKMSVNKDLLVSFVDIVPGSGGTYRDIVFIIMAVQ
jgi:hypothetical protein